MNRFNSDSDGDHSDDSLPWHEAKGADDPEDVNRVLPEAIQNWLRTRYTKLPQGTPPLAEVVSEELAFIASLPVIDEGDARYAREMRDILIKHACRICAEGRLAPDPSMRGELEADLELLNDCPAPVVSRSGIASALVQAYLRGSYVPDAAMREEVRYSLQRLRFENLPEEERSRKSNEILVPYANGRWGERATESGSEG